MNLPISIPAISIQLRITGFGFLFLIYFLQVERNSRVAGDVRRGVLGRTMLGSRRRSCHP